LVPYLYDLGISDCYVSPILKACAGSNHGYDITDHSQLNPEIGSEDDFTLFTEALQQKGMGLLADVVPNHMAIRDQANTWWFDVLENGPSSVYAQYFDIEWQPVEPELANRVLLPILEGQYGRVLEQGKLTLSYEDGAFYVSYYETKLPIAPGTYRQILEQRLDQVVASLGESHAHAQELQSILTALSYLPEHTELSAEKITERHREKEVIKRRIAALVDASPEVCTAIDDAVAQMNGQVGEPSSFDALDDLLRNQAYRLAFWRIATEEINYRRFFDVNELAAIRVELPEVFQATHQLIFRYLSEGKITGLRVDHPDGLWDPPRYFRRLQDSYFQLVNPVEPNGEEAFIAERPEGMAAPLYVVAEKILVDGENAPEGWEIYGTTGYDFLNAANGLFVDGKNRVAFDRVYNDFTKLRLDYRNLVNSSKKMIMLISLASEINALSHQLERVAEANRWYRDFTLNSLTFAIREVIACLPVYRTYIVGQDGRLSEHDRACIDTAVNEAQRRNPRTSQTIFEFIRDTLLLRNLHDFREEHRPQVIDFVMKFQQVTSPVMAKGIEDTAFYVYNRLISLNEVGGNPEQFGVPIPVFHQQNATRAMRWPHSLLASSTHDTKRSEDVRARISVLSELPQEWRAALEHWSRLNRRKKTDVNETPAPSADDEYMLYQSLLGVWPFESMAPDEFAVFRERIAAYMLKATKEAKVQTSWVNPNA
ncbi:MAG TPA: malto-oligosyltrehalose synthase, partial [Chloroflexota bacterium]|nr:malto-oligosyltrehalose synthase [Chloroflexota bacterium]